MTIDRRPLHVFLRMEPYRNDQIKAVCECGWVSTSTRVLNGAINNWGEHVRFEARLEAEKSCSSVN